MNARQFIVLFLASLSLSLIILIAFFSLFFKNLDIEFNAKLPESAPIPSSAPIIESNKSSGLTHAQVSLPPEDTLPMVGVGSNPAMPEAPPPPKEDTALNVVPATEQPAQPPSDAPSVPAPPMEPPPPPLPPVPDDDNL
jgi:hypothetical protein